MTLHARRYRGGARGPGELADPLDDAPTESEHGPHADADWSQATVKVTVPVHGTAMTIPAEVELTLAQLAALLEAHRGK